MDKRINSLNKRKVTVIGGGSFGTAIANIVASNGHDTVLWMRDKARAELCEATRENNHYLPGYRLCDDLTFSSNLEQSVSDSDITVVSVPSNSVREVAKSLCPYIKPNSILVSTTKGIETQSCKLMTQILEEEIPHSRVAALSGPNFAKEMVANQHTGTVIASVDKELNDIVQNVFSSTTFRVYSNEDKTGVELAGALKNIYAIIVGMAETLGCGGNTIAMLLTRGLAEMRRFSLLHGAKELTFLGLAGMGDLILTCSSDLSRNYRVGVLIAKGNSLEHAEQSIGQVAEGIYTLKTIWEKAKEQNIYMPLVNGLYGILYENKKIEEVVHTLMTAESSDDVQI